MKSKYFLTLTILFICVAGLSLVFFYTRDDLFSTKKAAGEKKNEEATSTEEKISPKKICKEKQVAITDGKTYCDLMTEAGIGYSEAMKIYNDVKGTYDLAKIRTGKNLNLKFTPDEEKIKELSYKINGEEELIIRNTASGTDKKKWKAEVRPINYKIKKRVASGTINSSLYKAAIDKGIDTRTIIKLANAFQWTVDFAMESKKGDIFKIYYEEKYLDGEYVMPGKILAAKYINDGKEHRIFYYEESEENKGYFTGDGKSVQKMFLKAPVSYKYISSGFTRGPRYLAKFNMYNSSHKAIDYAAEHGSPIRSVGAGTVTQAGWNSSGYGYLTGIRHNSTYTTRYAHQSKIIVKPGQKIKQGEVIGYIGSTGLSTGPHLHYEMIKHGQKINPLDEKLPPSQSIKENNMENFRKTIKPLKEKIN